MKVMMKDWQCQECGKLMTVQQAERAMTGTTGCLGCGGVDIDLAPVFPTAMIRVDEDGKPVKDDAECPACAAGIPIRKMR